MRADGVYLKKIDPMYKVAAYVMDKRYDAMNMITLDIPIEPMREYIHRKNKEGLKLSHLSLVLASYLRTMAEFPALNRFVVNKKIYARKEVAVGMVVLRPAEEAVSPENQGTMSKMYFDVSDDIFTVAKTIDEYVKKNRDTANENGTDELLRKLLAVPGLLNISVGLLKFLDKHNIMPKSIIDKSPFHTSFVISNLATIKTNHIFHHVYEFGTTSYILTLGNFREVPKRVGKEIVFERCLPIGMAMDERICSGSYYAAAFAKFKKYLANPVLLEGKPSVINKDF